MSINDWQRKDGPATGAILSEIRRVADEREARGITLQESEVPSRQGGALAAASARRQADKAVTKAATVLAEDPGIFALADGEHEDAIAPLREAHRRLLKAWRARTGRNPSANDHAFWTAFNRVVGVWSDGVREGK